MHQEIIGRSRFGKSTYLEHQILSSGRFVFLDPHGHNAARIADTIDCIYWDCAETKFVVGFNPLKDIPKVRRHLVAEQTIYAFKAIWADSWGPRLEHILRHSLLLLLDNNGAITDIPQLLTDTNYRSRLLRKATHTDFWENEFEQWEDRYRNDAIGPVLNKVGAFAVNPIISAILTTHTLDFGDLMASGKCLVVNLNKGKLGAEPAHLLGALLIASLYSAAQEREPGSPTFHVFADEFQNFATQSFADILSEAGKYGLDLTLCHQYLAQVPPSILPSIFANVSTITAFNVSAEDAEFLAPEMGLVPEHLTDLAKYQYRRKNGESVRRDGQPPAATRKRLEANRRNTAARYARPARHI